MAGGCKRYSRSKEMIFSELGFLVNAKTGVKACLLNYFFKVNPDTNDELSRANANRLSTFKNISNDY